MEQKIALDPFGETLGETGGPGKIISPRAGSVSLRDAPLSTQSPCHMSSFFPVFAMFAMTTMALSVTLTTLGNFGRATLTRLALEFGTFYTLPARRYVMTIFFDFWQLFFGISVSLTSLKFGMEQARGKSLLYVFEWPLSCVRLRRSNAAKSALSAKSTSHLSWLLPAYFQIFFKETNRTFVGEVFSFNLRPLTTWSAVFSRRR